MISEDVSFQLFNFLYAVICIILTGPGILLVRLAPDAVALRARVIAAVSILGTLTLVGALIAYASAGVWTVPYVFGLYVSFCFGIALETIESDPARFKANNAG